MKDLNHQQIVDLVNQDATRKILFRSRIDMRYTDRNGMMMDPKRRNRESSLFDFFKEISKGQYIVELEELETNEKQIVFHGYTSNDLY